MDQPNDRAEWFLARDDYQHGPISADELMMLAAAGHVDQTDFVWRAGMPEWIPAGDMEGLLALRTHPDPLLNPHSDDRPPPGPPYEPPYTPSQPPYRTHEGSPPPASRHGVRPGLEEQHRRGVRPTGGSRSAGSPAGDDRAGADSSGMRDAQYTTGARRATPRDGGIVLPLLFLGAVIGLGLGWINRPSVLFGMQLGLPDVLELLSSKAPIDRQIVGAHAQTFAIYTVVGAALGATIGLVLDRR